jgi:hypothetical protein
MCEHPTRIKPSGGLIDGQNKDATEYMVYGSANMGHKLAGLKISEPTS